MRVSAWSAAAWVALAATAAFLLLTFWWLTQDRAMPYGDSAEHLMTAFYFHDRVLSGDLLRPLVYHSVYAPLAPFIGSLGIFVGGRTVAAPVIAENLVFVPLLALGCYHVGRLAFGRMAGALAVVFALGSPLIAEQFHVLMLDAPQAALVAACVWLVAASDRFRRVGLSAAVGAVVGLGLIEKQSFALYVAGFLLLVLLRGGWRNWRGISAFLVVAFVIAAPWYAAHLSDVETFTGVAGGGPTVPILAKPPLLSLDNLLWYFWATANGLLFAPLLTFAVVGVVFAVVAVARHRETSDLVPELIGGLALAWLAITVLPHHDMRYTMPLIVYVAVLATGWIPRLPRTPRTVVLAVLAGAVVATTLGATFGVGTRSETPLPGTRFAPRGEGVPPLETIVVYSSNNLLVSGPREGGDILGVMKALRHEGVREVVGSDDEAPIWDPDYNANGLLLFARMARLRVPTEAIEFNTLEARQALMLRRPELPGAGPPCARLPNGDGVWVSIGAPSGDALRWCAKRAG
ncbi:MAG TPA: glycosyltransferase family 39 protein [Conexibacter sp.]|nr:glycosyltransferase family 39 protein [Conexibacter sp.]